MTPVHSLSLLLAASLVVLAVMTVLVSGRKVLRDHRELRSRRRIAALREVLATGDGAAVRAALRRIRGIRAQLDLVRVMDELLGTMAPERLEDLQQAAGECDFVARLRRATGDRDPATRGRALLLLTRLRLPDSVTDLGRMLHDPDPDVRLTACAGIATSRDPRGVPALLDALAHGWLQPERVIERIGEPWAVDALLDALRLRAAAPERDTRTIIGIVRALGSAGDRRAEPVLLGLLAGGEGEERISAARALGAIGAEQAAPALIAGLGDPSWPLRAQCAKSLGGLGAATAVPALEAALTDRAWWVRANAAASLRELGEAGIAALRRAAGSEDRYARDRAREALSLISVGAREPVVGVLELSGLVAASAPAPQPLPDRSAVT